MQIRSILSDYFLFRPCIGEARGVGGIFFDDLETPSAHEIFEFIRVCSLVVFSRITLLLALCILAGHIYVE